MGSSVTHRSEAGQLETGPGGMLSPSLHPVPNIPTSV